MKTKSFFAMVAAIFLAVTIDAHAQSQTQFPGPEIQQKAVRRTDFLTGVVSDWIMNVKEYVYDGFYLQTQTEKIIVIFPTSMANDLRRDVKVGNTISVKGIRGNDTLGIKRINLISVIVDGQTIPNNPVMLADSLVAGETVYGSAKIIAFQKNTDGKISGYVLDNKTILRVGPNINSELERALVLGANLTYSGIKSGSGSGEDAWSTYAVIVCQTITIHGKQYLTR
jgi:hypothetical protein